MAMGKRKPRQESLFVPTDRLLQSAGHPFYERLNALLAEADFDGWLERRCVACYEQEEARGRPSIAPGVYFRMLLIGYFEGIDSQRGIAWRCADSLSLRSFLGVPLTEPTPDHSTLTNTRLRLPAEIFEEVFQFVLGIAHVKQLLAGKTVGVDSTTLEANAAMKSIVRRDTGEDWKQFVTRLMREEGVMGANEQPSDEEIRRFDKKRQDKKVSNADWQSPADEDARIARMKDGTTHRAYKAEHVVDLESELVLAAEIRPADHADTATFVDSVAAAQINLQQAGSETVIAEAAADKGYHAAATIELSEALDIRTYIPEPTRAQPSKLADKSAEERRAVGNNRRRVQRAKSKALQRRRSEVVERTFAHICEMGGSRRSHLRGLVNVTKRYLLAAAAHNLGRILRCLTGVGKPRVLQGARGLAARMACSLLARARTLYALLSNRLALIVVRIRPFEVGDQIVLLT
jgi:transposase